LNGILTKIKNILVVASSARMLVQYAKKAGFSALAIDCFADYDTQCMALGYVKVNSLSLVDIKAAVCVLTKQYDISHVVYGSGLEDHLTTLEYLEQNFIVLGNSSDVFLSVQDKAHFFLELKKLHIVYPETVFEQPEKTAGWLQKPLKGEGGIGITRAEIKSTSDYCYWQKFCAGTPLSALFIANGSEHKIIGFQKQEVTRFDADEFVFSAVISQPEMDRLIIRYLDEIICKLVSAFSLKGINSLDFIANNQQYYVLEINPRFSASLNLYSSGFFLAHIDSCLEGGQLPALKSQNSYKGYKIIFSEVDFIIKQQIDWPDWVVDIPIKGSIINTAMPICSIIAGGKNEQQVDDLLLERQRQLIKLLT